MNANEVTMVQLTGYKGNSAALLGYSPMEEIEKVCELQDAVAHLWDDVEIAPVVMPDYCPF